MSLLTYRGVLEKWDLSTFQPVARHEFQKRRGGALAYSADGRLLAVGFVNGFVSIRHDSGWTDVANFRNTAGVIDQLAFSQCGQYLAYLGELARC